MRKTVLSSVAALCGLFSLSNLPAEAHVKWFLSKPIEELLKEPKPLLFSQWCPGNIVPLAATFAFLVATCVAAQAHKQSRVNRQMMAIGEKFEPWVNAFIGVCTGICLIHCAINLQLFAPNFIICSHCPKWLPFAEAMVGVGLLLGLFTRISAMGLLGLLAFTFFKHSPADCLDLVPLYGLGFYFLLAGRNRYSLDFVFGLDRLSEIAFDRVGHFAMRFCAGLGLIILALDEKLIHPQLALDLIHKVPSLNFMHPFMGNDMFILLAGLVEFSLGFAVAMGTFPRLGVLGLALTFTATTFLFGSPEIFGHAPYYGIVVAILLNGSGQLSVKELITSLSEALHARLGRIHSQLVPQM